MTTVREPRLEPVAILELRPTQITVGMREVKAKRKRWREESRKKGEEFLGKHLIPVILGPKHRHYDLVMENGRRSVLAVADAFNDVSLLP